ncbi:MAG: hypothetical protein ABEJ70_06075 [Halobacteriaceae archaeon]
MDGTNGSGAGPTYRPGRCNIGAAERRRRRVVGGLGVAAAVAVVVLVVAVGHHPGWLLLTAVPAFVGYLGLWQARRGFCVGFARRGVFDVSEDGERRVAVRDASDRASDRATARRMLAAATVAALVTGVAVYVAGRGVL